MKSFKSHIMNEPEIEELINEALRHGKDSFALRKTAEELATQLSNQIGDMHLPDSDSVRYESQSGKKRWKKMKPMQQNNSIKLSLSLNLYQN